MCRPLAGHIKPGTVKNQLFAALDWMPTLVDIAGGPKGDGLKKQIEAGQYPGIVKTTLDGVNQRDFLEGKSEKSARDYFFYFSGSTPSAVRYKNWKMYYTMSQPGPAGWIMPLVPFHFTLVQNIKRDPFEQAVGIEQKSAMSLGGALGAPATAFQYDWNMLPIGQQLWLKHLMSYETFPPLQAPETYNLSQVMEQVKKANHPGDYGLRRAGRHGRAAPRSPQEAGWPAPYRRSVNQARHWFVIVLFKPLAPSPLIQQHSIGFNHETIHPYLRHSALLCWQVGCASLWLDIPPGHAQTDPRRRGMTAPPKRPSSILCDHDRPGHPKYVPPEARIATFDQDGTLWVEHPMYTQVVYCLERAPAVVRKARTEGRRAVQDRTLRRPRGDRETPDEGSRRDPRRDALRHDGGRVSTRR